MTTLELERIARTTIPPVGATQAIAIVEGRLGEKLPTGHPSGIGGQTRYGAAWLIDGLRRSPAIATFDRQADALRLVGILNGDVQTSRPTAERHAPPSPEAPGRVLPSDPVIVEAAIAAEAVISPGRVCDRCGRALPVGSRPQRRTCSDACRQELARSRRSATDPALPVVTVSEPMELGL